MAMISFQGDDMIRFFKLFVLLGLFSCALKDDYNESGFFFGFWNGLTSLLALFMHMISPIFENTVSFYAKNPTYFYPFGFFFGIAIIFSILFASGGSKSNNEDV